jgi:hypothetical protein
MRRARLVRVALRLAWRTTLDRPTTRPIDHGQRRKTGVTGLDEMLGGGIPAGYWS